MAKKKKVKKEFSDEQEAVTSWFSRIVRAENRRHRSSQRYEWDSILEGFKGNFKTDQLTLDPNFRIPPVNLLWAYVKSEIANMALKDPHFEVNPKKGSSIMSGKIREIALNYIWRHKRVKRENKKNLLDAKTVGHSWFKSGYTGRFGTIEMDSGKTDEFIESEDFFGKWVSWKDVIFNPESIDPPFDTMWIAHRFFAPLSEVKSNTNYKHTDELQGSPLESKDDDSSHNDNDTFTLWVKMYEIWDKTNNQVFTIAEGLDKYLEAPKKWPYKMRGFPFSYLAFNEINEDGYPIPEVYMFLPQIINHIKIRFQQMDHLKRANRIIESPIGNLSDEEEGNMGMGLTGTVVHPKQAGQIRPVEFNNVPVDSYAIEGRNMDDFVTVSGQSNIDRGGVQKSPTRTVGELLEIQKGGKNRRSEQIDTFEDFLEDIARNQISLLMQFATEPFYVKVTGKESAEIMEQLALRPSAQDPEAVTTSEGFTFTKEDIQGEFDVDVKVGSTIPLDRDNKIQLFLRIAEIAPSLGMIPGGPVAGALGKMFGDELDMPELERAIKAEAELQAKLKQEQKEQQEQAQQIQAAQFGTEKQLEAEKIQSNLTGDQIKFASTVVNARGGKNGDKGVSN